MIHLESASRHRYFGVWVPSDLHVWVGSRGLHLFWPDVWKSSFDRVDDHTGD